MVLTFAGCVFRIIFNQNTDVFHDKPGKALIFTERLIYYTLLYHVVWY
jgi:uncharacterized Fe-S radical SAM superfamily protein PflX